MYSFYYEGENRNSIVFLPSKRFVPSRQFVAQLVLSTYRLGHTAATTTLPISAMIPLPSPSPSPRGPAKRRANDLLRNYYGLDESNAATSSSPTQRNDPDSNGFDAQAAFQTMLQEKSLSQLLKTESDLLTEIRELDGERQSLVYNHHHELVSASETIGRVSEVLIEDC